MRRSRTLTDVSQTEPQKKCLRRCYSESTAMNRMGHRSAKDLQKPSHPLIGMLTLGNILHYPSTPKSANSTPRNSFSGNRKGVTSSPNDIQIPGRPPISSPFLPQPSSLKSSSSSESLSSMFGKSSINTQKKKPMLRSTKNVHRAGQGVSSNDKEKTGKQTKSGKKRRIRRKRTDRSRQSHNKTERFRTQRIRNAILDIKKLLEEHGLSVQREKVKVLQSALTHMMHLKEELEESKKQQKDLCARVQQMEEAHHQLLLQQHANARRIAMQPITANGFVEKDSADRTFDAETTTPFSNAVAAVDMVEVDAVPINQPSDMPTTSMVEVEAVSDVPAIVEVDAVPLGLPSDMPGMVEVEAVSDMPDMVEVDSVSDMPDMVEVDSVSDMPDMVDMDSVSDMPDMVEVETVSDMPDMVDMDSVSDMPDLVEVDSVPFSLQTQSPLLRPQHPVAGLAAAPAPPGRVPGSTEAPLKFEEQAQQNWECGSPTEFNEFLGCFSSGDDWIDSEDMKLPEPMAMDPGIPEQTGAASSMEAFQLFQ